MDSTGQENGSIFLGGHGCPAAVAFLSLWFLVSSCRTPSETAALTQAESSAHWFAELEGGLVCGMDANGTGQVWAPRVLSI